MTDLQNHFRALVEETGLTLKAVARLTGYGYDAARRWSAGTLRPPARVIEGLILLRNAQLKIFATRGRVKK
jgi:hypothetical protein